MKKRSPAAENRIFFKLQRAAHSLKKRADDALLAAGELTTAQAAALMIIGQNAPVSQREIAQSLQQNESAMTAMIRRLLALGYVERQRAADDVRRWDLSITEAGENALKQGAPAFGQVNSAIETALSSKEITELARMLDAIAAVGKAAE
jgi:DNA-binding MarR family transcriptional regulator